MKYHPDKNNNSEESKRKFQEIQEAYELLLKNSGRGDSSSIDDDALFLAKQKIENALAAFNLTKEEVFDDETFSNYKEKLDRCKNKGDLEDLVSQVIFFIQMFSRAKDKGWFDKDKNKKREAKKPTSEPTEEPRTKTDYSSTTPENKTYKEFVCDYCGFKVEASDPRPKYTFEEHKDKSFCSENCRTYWSNKNFQEKSDEAKDQQEKEWEEYRQKFREKMNNFGVNPESDSYLPNSNSNNNNEKLDQWLKDFKKRNEEGKERDLKGAQKSFISSLTSSLILYSITDEELNKELRVSDWKEEIYKCSTWGEAFEKKKYFYWDVILKINEVKESAGKEFVCAKCKKNIQLKKHQSPYIGYGDIKNKKFCSLECLRDAYKEESNNKQRGEKVLGGIMVLGGIIILIILLFRRGKKQKY